MVGGLALMWDDDVNVKYVWNTVRIIWYEVLELEQRKLWNLFACYGPFYNTMKWAF